MNKLSVKRMKWTVCDDSPSSSSSDDDVLPILPNLPESSSSSEDLSIIVGELPTIEESNLEYGAESDASSESSLYMSSLMDGGLSDVSSVDNENNHYDGVNNYDDGVHSRLANEEDSSETVRYVEVDEVVSGVRTFHIVHIPDSADHDTSYESVSVS